MRTLAVLTREGFTSQIVERDDKSVVFTADADIDADGAYRAYHPDNRSGLDDLRNARNGDEWCGVVTFHGEPVIQGPRDPAPGFYVSPTSLHLRGPDGEPLPAADPRRYVDAETVPFIVVPPAIINGVAGVVLGCQARVTNLRNHVVIDAVVADVGPRTKDGELSIAAAKALGIPPSPRSGGEDRPLFVYELWPGVPAVVEGVTYPLQAA